MNKLKDALKAAKDSIEARLKEEQKRVCNDFFVIISDGFGFCFLLQVQVDIIEYGKVYN